MAFFIITQTISFIIKKFINKRTINGEAVEKDDVNELILRFGCSKIDQELLKKFERITGKPCHHFLRRGIFFSHRDLDTILNLYEQGKPFYLYTGSPVSDLMDIGNLIPFLFCKWLQDVLDVPLVIQLTDDETAASKNLDLEKAISLAYENCKDIIACGFDINKTFIFSNLEHIGNNSDFYKNIFRIKKSMTCVEMNHSFDFGGNNLNNEIVCPVNRIVSSISTSFPFIFEGAKIPCLIPCTIDQDPFFSLARDVAPKLGFSKPALIHSMPLPALQGSKTKMSTSNYNKTIFLIDTAKKIRNKINKYAFSGGQATIEEHERLGGNCDVDISYQWLRFFLEDDNKLAELKKNYESGALLTGALKDELIKVLQKIIIDHQERKKTITRELIKKYMEKRDLGFTFKEVPSAVVEIDSKTVGQKELKKKERKNLKNVGDEVIFPLKGMDDYDNIEISEDEIDTDDSGQDEGIHIPRRQRGGHPTLAKSLPVSVPNFSFGRLVQ